MTPPSEEYIATHREPLQRERSDFVFLAALEVDSGEREWEQLWGRIVAQHRVEICCIPFFVYDLNLGDIVELDQNNVLARVITRSGLVTFRAWLEGMGPETRVKLLAEVDAISACHEWSSLNLVALSVHQTQARELADLLERWATDGQLVYDTGTQVGADVIRR